MTVLPQYSTWGSRVGGSIESAISGGLKEVAAHKIQKMQDRKQQRALEPLLGKAGYQAFKGLPPKIQEKVFENPAWLDQLRGLDEQQQGESPESLLQQIMAMQQEQQQQPQQQFQQQQMQQNQMPQQMGRENAGPLSGIQQLYQSLAGAQGHGQGRPLDALQRLQDILGEARPEIPQAQQPVQQIRPRQIANPNGQQELSQLQPQAQQDQQEAVPRAPKKSFAEALMKPHEHREIEKLELQKKKMASQEDQFNHKATAPIVKEISLAGREAKANLARLDRMQTLNDSGKLDNPLYLELLKKTGFDIGFFKSPESQEFQKIEVDFLKNARSIFGSRVTNYEMSTFLKSIPSLSQSKEGRESVIRNLKLVEEGKEVRSKAMNDIIKENNGKAPLNIEQQVDDRTEAQTDKILQQFRQGEQGKVEKSFKDLPDPASLNGRKIRDRDTGKLLHSNGKEWIEVQ